MNDEELINWLLTNGGPVIRYRTATELMATPGSVDIGLLRKELLSSALVKSWFEHAIPSLAFNYIHGSKATTFENVMGKLTDLGLRRGVPEFDQYTLPYRKWLSENVNRPPAHISSIFIRTLIAAFLARAGYNDEPAVGTVLRNRLETIHDFVRQGSYDIYVDPADYPQMPRSFQKKPLINPMLSRDGNLSLPLIYDIIGLAAYLPEYGTEDDWVKATTIFKYVLNDQYQKLHPGYGILRTKNGRYYAIGWAVWLPGSFGDPSYETRRGWSSLRILGAFIQRLILMGQFSAAIRHPWFVNSMNHLQGLKTENGTYLFPRSYLPEKPIGYWVTGARMALEENRRKGLALVLESTFWMMKLQLCTNEP
ncbi:hypothetical protein ACFLYQ_05925 [Chloroflexota bacterium]